MSGFSLVWYNRGMDDDEYRRGGISMEMCAYCGRNLTLASDFLGNRVCLTCSPAVIDSLGRWGDLRGHNRHVTDSERVIPRGKWCA
jgi:hypothetical protein